MIKFNPTQKEKHWLITSAVILFVLWVLGPFIAIAGDSIFAGIGTRLILSLLCIAGWIGYFWFKQQKKTPNRAISENEQNLLDDLDAQIEQAIEHIHEKSGISSIDRLKKIKSTPWVLLIGPQGAGKTSLLTQAKLNFTSFTKKSLNNTNPTQAIDWWVSNEIVFIDPSAKYCLASETDVHAYHYWHHFIERLSKQQPHPFDSVCLLIDLPSLLQPEGPSFESLISRLQEQILFLAKHCQPLCLNLVINQCDHLHGFAEFFSNLGQKQLEQPLGFSLIDSSDQKHISDLFHQRFKEFMILINRRLIDRLHNEQNLDRRMRINDMPLQLERLEGPLNKLINSIPDGSNIVVNHVFFCSTQQTAHTVNLLSDDLAKTFQLPTQSTAPLIANQQSLFIPQMIQALAQPHAPEAAIAEVESKKWVHLLGYPVAIAALTIATSAFHHSFEQNTKALNIVNTHFKTTSTGSSLLSVLNNLHTTHTELDKVSLTGSTPLGFTQAKHVKEQLNQTYQTYLKHQFVSYLNQTIAAEIKLESDTNSPALYNTLRTYLMIGNKQRLDKAFVVAWFKQFWATQLAQDNTTQAELKTYLQDTLKLQSINWEQDQPLIERAQHILQKQPLSQIAFKILRNSNSLKAISIEESQTIAGINLKSASIPQFYATSNFSNIYNNKIPELAESIFKGNWVMGRTQHKNGNLKQMTYELQSIYTQAYIMQWQHTLGTITLTEPKNYTEAITQLNLITNPQSPLWQIYQNAIDVAKKAGAKDIQNSLADYMPPHSDSKPMISALDELKNYLAGINKSPSSIKTSFDVAQKRFQTNGSDDPITNALKTANTLPSPLQPWTKAATINSWKLILNNASSYLNTLWQADVMPTYNRTIKNRYPIFSDASADISPNDFDQFFGPGGALQDYFNSSLKNFINLSKSYWTWKKLDGESVNIPQSYLDMMIRASMIQKMFYKNSSHTPSVRFKLTPLDMSMDSSQFIINVGGQMVRYMPGVKKTSLLKWPGTDGDFVTMRFDNSEDNNPTLTTMGPWAWLRMLDHAEIEPTGDPSIFKVDFKLQNNDAEFQLVADNPVNPYLQNLLTSFRCTDNLMSDS